MESFKARLLTLQAHEAACELSNFMNDWLIKYDESVTVPEIIAIIGFMVGQVLNSVPDDKLDIVKAMLTRSMEDGLAYHGELESKN